MKTKLMGMGACVLLLGLGAGCRDNTRTATAPADSEKPVAVKTIPAQLREEAMEKERQEKAEAFIAEIEAAQSRSTLGEPEGEGVGGSGPADDSEEAPTSVPAQGDAGMGSRNEVAQ